MGGGKNPIANLFWLNLPTWTELGKKTNQNSHCSWGEGSEFCPPWLFKDSVIIRGSNPTWLWSIHHYLVPRLFNFNYSSFNQRNQNTTFPINSAKQFVVDLMMIILVNLYCFIVQDLRDRVGSTVSTGVNLTGQLARVGVPLVTRVVQQVGILVFLSSSLQSCLIFLSLDYCRAQHCWTVAELC